MAATVANVSALLLPPATTTSNTSKLSDCGAGSAGDSGGAFAKTLDAAQGATSAKSGTDATPSIVVISRPTKPPKPVRKRPPAPRRGEATPYAAATDEEGNGSGAPADSAGAAGEAAQGGAAEGECNDSEGTEATGTEAHQAATSDPSVEQMAQTGAMLPAVATGVSAATSGTVQTANDERIKESVSQRASSQPVAQQAPHEAGVAPPSGATAGDPSAEETKAQEAAAAFERGLSVATAANPRPAAVATAPPSAEGVSADPGLKPANARGSAGKQPQLPAITATEMQVNVDPGAGTAREGDRAADAPADEAEKLGQIFANDAALSQPHAAAHSRDVSVPPQQQPAGPPDLRFAETNHANIVSGVRTTLLPHGGSMQIRLDPPELGALQVMVEMRGGAMTATFQTSNADATRLLSHSLGQLKTALESQGVTVQKIQVQQAPKDHPASNYEDQSRQHQRDDANARQEQQRREMLRRMWRRISGGIEPVDLFA